MDFTVRWTSLAELTYTEEIDFILSKWSNKQVVDFIELIDDFLEKLLENPYMGKLSNKRDMHFFVVSKQTTVIYKIYPDFYRIDLLMFHNNKRNHTDILKYL